MPGAPPSPYTRPQDCPKIFLKNRTWYQTRKHVCAKARLRNTDFLRKSIRKDVENPREASTLVFKIRSCRSDLLNKHEINRKSLILRSVLTVQHRILKIRVLTSLGSLLNFSYGFHLQGMWHALRPQVPATGARNLKSAQSG